MDESPSVPRREGFLDLDPAGSPVEDAYIATPRSVTET